MYYTCEKGICNGSIANQVIENEAAFTNDLLQLGYREKEGISIYPVLDDFHSTLVICLHASGLPSLPSFAAKTTIVMSILLDAKTTNVMSILLEIKSRNSTLALKDHVFSFR